MTVRFPRIQFEPPFDKHRRAFRKVLGRDFRLPSPKRNVDERRLVDPITGGVSSAVVDGEPNIRNGKSTGNVPHLGITGQVSDQDHSIETRHGICLGGQWLSQAPSLKECRVLAFHFSNNVGFVFNLIKNGVGRFRFGFLRLCSGVQVAGPGVFDKRIDQTRIDMQEKETQDIVADLELSCQLLDFLRVDPKIGQPVRPPAMPFDRISQFSFIPKSCEQHFATELFDNACNLTGNLVGIARINIGIENKQAFVNVLSHDWGWGWGLGLVVLLA